MKKYQVILLIQVIIATYFITGCSDRTDRILFCNHLEQHDTISDLDFESIDFETCPCTSRSFCIDSIEFTSRLKKIADKTILRQLQNNIVINGFQDHDMSLSYYHSLNFWSRILMKLNKKAFDPEKNATSDYFKFKTTTTFLINDFYLYGRLDLFKNLCSYVVINCKSTREPYGFSINEKSYFLLNVNQSKKVVSTIKLAFFRTNSDGLSFLQEKLRSKIFLNHWLCFDEISNIITLDKLPGYRNNQKKTFILRLDKKGVVK